MARVELPKTSLRARRRRRRLITASIVVVAALLVLAALVGISYLPFLRVTVVSVSGTQTISTSSIEGVAMQSLRGAYGYLFSKSNIFLYPKDTIATALVAKYPTLKSVDVHAGNFHTIEVAVIERQPKALWCSSSSARCNFMDEDGVAYAAAPDFSEPIYVSYLGGSGTLPHQYLTTEQFHNLSALVDALSQTEPLDPVERVEVDSNNDVHAYYKGGFELIFALKDASGDVFDRYTLAKKSEPFVGHQIEDFVYLDLRFGDKLYYKQK